jgi:hypothetical protein
VGIGIDDGEMVLHGVPPCLNRSKGLSSSNRSKRSSRPGSF